MTPRPRHPAHNEMDRRDEAPRRGSNLNALAVPDRLMISTVHEPRLASASAMRINGAAIGKTVEWR